MRRAQVGPLNTGFKMVTLNWYQTEIEIIIFISKESDQTSFKTYVKNNTKPNSRILQQQSQ